MPQMRRLCTGLLIGGGLDEAVDEALAASSLAADCDPVIASSYFNALSRCFILLGRYGDALSLADRSIDLAESARLRFAVPHALISKAIALLGLRDHASVEDALDEAERLAADIHDRHNLVDARAVRSRLALSLGDTEAAISATDDPPYGVIDAMRAEYVPPGHWPWLAPDKSRRPSTNWTRSRRFRLNRTQAASQ